MRPHATSLFLCLAALASLGACKREETAACNAGTVLLRVACDSNVGTGSFSFDVLVDSQSVGRRTGITHACPFALEVNAWGEDKTLPSKGTLVVRATMTEPAGRVVAAETPPLELTGQRCSSLDLTLPGAGTTGSTDGGAKDASISSVKDARGSDSPTDGPRVTGGPDGATGGTKLKIGSTCAADSECEDGACANGVCCDRACTGKCESCDQQDFAGHCRAIAAGQPSDNAADCPVSAADPCGQDGTCDGQGACRRVPDDTVCSPGQCAGDVLKGGKVCKAGACSGTATDTACAPFNCNPDSKACYDSCTSEAQCSAGQSCRPLNGKMSCGLKSLGARCAGNDECGSGQCADGVCCDGACDGVCQSCNQPGANLGHCSAVAAGEAEPKCAADPSKPCGLTGTCAAGGVCAQAGSNVTCALASCAADNSFTASASCDGAGHCPVPAAVSCKTLVCTKQGCPATCSSDADCIAGHYCNGTTCVPKKADGIACAAGANRECVHNICSNGNCCATACDDVCSSCASGTCTNTCKTVSVGPTLAFSGSHRTEDTTRTTSTTITLASADTSNLLFGVEHETYQTSQGGPEICCQSFEYLPFFTFDFGNVLPKGSVLRRAKLLFKADKTTNNPALSVIDATGPVTLATANFGSAVTSAALLAPVSSPTVTFARAGSDLEGTVSVDVTSLATLSLSSGRLSIRWTTGTPSYTAPPASRFDLAYYLIQPKNVSLALDFQ